jgi:hypothetical protein
MTSCDGRHHGNGRPRVSFARARHPGNPAQSPTTHRVSDRWREKILQVRMVFE